MSKFERDKTGPSGNGGPVHRLIGYIGRKKLVVGDGLPPIRQLAAELRLKPTVMRDALQAAQTMGLLRVLPRSGTVVQSLSFEPLVNVLSGTLQASLAVEDQNLIDMMETRRVLEI